MSRSMMHNSGIVCLHCHSCYSDGYLEPHEIEAYSSTFAITDHGTLSSHYFHSDRSKVIRGIEIYVDLPLELLGQKRRNRSACHLTLLADGYEGWLELVKLNYEAWKNYYYVPRMNLFDLECKSLIVLSGCPSSPIGRLFFMGKLDEAERVYKYLSEKFRGRFYAEVQYGTPIQDAFSKFVVEMASKYGDVIVYTQDAHYSRDTYRLWKFTRHGFDCDSIAIDNTVPEHASGYYANSVSLAHDLRSFSVSKQFLPKQDEESLFYLRRRIAEYKPGLSDEDKSIIEYELSVMKEREILGYMVLADKVFSIAKSVGKMAIARGSVAASLVAHVLGWTPFHPQRHGLIFERFLSRYRKEMPDVDIDVPADKREEIIKEISKVYKIAYITTEMRYAERAAKNQVERKSKEMGLELDDNGKVEIANLLCGRMFALGVHASGVAILDDESSALVPLRVVDGKDVCEWSMNHLPVVKMDILGQKTMDVVLACCSDMSTAMVIDDDVINSIKSDTVGVFQIEGAMRHFARYSLSRVSDVSVDDIAFVISMYRPAVIDIGLLDSYSRSEFRDIEISDEIRALCKHGAPVYQEDLLRVIARYIPIEHAYTLMKILAKKDKEKAVSFLKEIGATVPESVMAFVESYAGYSFNMAHAVSYAYRAYLTAYVRQKYPSVFWPIMIDKESDDVVRACYILRAARHFDVYPPDGKSFATRIEGEKLILGMSIVPGYGKNGRVVRNGDYKSMIDSMNKRDRKVVEDSGLLDYWVNNKLDVSKLSLYMRVPCFVNKAHFSGTGSLSLAIDKAILSFYRDGLCKTVTVEVMSWSDGERVTDGTDILWCKCQPGYTRRKIMVTASKYGKMKLWARYNESNIRNRPRSFERNAW